MAGERINQTPRNNIIDAINFNIAEEYNLHVKDGKFYKYTKSQGAPGIVCVMENGDVKTVLMYEHDGESITHEGGQTQGTMILDTNTGGLRFCNHLTAHLNDGEILFGIFNVGGTIISPSIKNMKVNIVQDTEDSAE